MPLRYLLDEHLRGPLWRSIKRHNASGGPPLDAVRVGDIPDVPLGAGDPEILTWAAREQRILVTSDKSTMAMHLSNFLAAGRHSPGLFMVSPKMSLHDVLAYLVLAAYASDPAEWSDRIQYLT